MVGSAHDGTRLCEGLIDSGNTCGDVWTGTAFNSAENKTWLKENGLNSRMHPPQEAVRAYDGQARREGRWTQIEDPGEG